MKFHTDLALEIKEYNEKKTLDGVIFSERTHKNIKITEIDIINENGEKTMSKPQGKYITLESDKIYSSTNKTNAFISLLSAELKKLLPKKGSVLVAGLGNSKITPDALGPMSVSLIFATRHLSNELKETLGLTHLRSVSAIVPGVLGTTGIETAEIISGVVKKAKADAVIVIDALSSRSTFRLGTTIQLTDSGISPGSGVGNHRNEISQKTLGIPVIAIGVPTVVDGATMVIDTLQSNNINSLSKEQLSLIKESSAVMVTPKDIDELIKRCAEIIAMAINLSLQESLSLEELWEIVG